MTAAPGSLLDRIELSRLASPPGVLRTILRAVDEGEVDDARLARLIARDPALLGRLLHLAAPLLPEATALDFRRVECAVAAIGRDVLRMLLIDSLSRPHPGPGSAEFESGLGELWACAQRCAEAAAALAEATGSSERDTAFLVGMLHDIGMLAARVVEPAYAGQAAEIETEAQRLDLERSLLGQPHTEIGADLADRWSLPTSVGDALLMHHDPVEQLRDADLLVRIVRSAVILSEDEESIGAAVGLIGTGEAVLAEIMASARHRAEEAIAGLLGQPIAPAASESRGWPGEDAAVPLVDDDFATDGELLVLDTLDGEPPAPAPAIASDQPARSNRPSEAAPPSGLGELFQSMLGQLAGQILGQAADEDGVLTRLQCLAIGLFDLPAPALFLPDERDERLVGRMLGRRAAEFARLAIPASGSASIVAQTLRGASQAEAKSAFDRQLLRLLRVDRLIGMPLQRDGSAWGVAVFGCSAQMHDRLQERVSRFVPIGRQAAGALIAVRAQTDRDGTLRAEALEQYRLHARRIAHEAGNPLSVMKNYLQLVRMKLGADAGLQAEFKVLDEEIDRISGIVRRLGDADFAGDADSGAVDLNALIREMLSLYGDPLFARRRIAVDAHLDPTLPSLHTDRAAVKQILLNLFKNASEAMPKGGRLTVITSDSVNHAGAPHAEIRIVDTGPGIPPDAMPQLFRSDRSTKRDGRGGLGLTIVLSLLRRIGGTITCRSQPGKGTAFQILLPKQDDPVS